MTKNRSQSVPRQLTVALTENAGRFQLIGTFPHYDHRGEPAHRQIALSEELQINRSKALELAHEICGLLTLLNPSTIAIFSDKTESPLS